MNGLSSADSVDSPQSGGCSPLAPLFSSSIGRKLLMAVTGLLLIGFVIGHLLGNLQIFLGAETFNHYAETLQKLGPLLWVIRIGLLTVFLVHLILGFQLRKLNRAARPVGYKNMSTVKATPASLLMLETGIVILIFLVIHLLHFTFMTFHPEFSSLIDEKGRHDVFSMVVLGFQNTGYAATYIFCMIMLGIHLSHGLTSAFQTLGLNSPFFTPRARTFGRVLAYAIAAAYISIPLAVQLGLVHLAAKGASL